MSIITSMTSIVPVAVMTIIMSMVTTIPMTITVTTMQMKYWGVETAKVYSQAQIEEILTALDSGEYGMILRSKGMVAGEDGNWVYFDYVPEEHDIRSGKPEVTGKLCVIGAELKEEKIAELFGV